MNFYLTKSLSRGVSGDRNFLLPFLFGIKKYIFIKKKSWILIDNVCFKFIIFINKKFGKTYISDNVIYL